MKSCVGTGFVNGEKIPTLSIHSATSLGAAGFVMASKTARITKTRQIVKTQQQPYEVDKKYTLVVYVMMFVKLVTARTRQSVAV